MSRSCSACLSPYRSGIDQRIRSGVALTDVSGWLLVKGSPISRQALGRHNSRHLALAVRQPGPRPASGDFLQMVRDSVAADVAAGVQTPSITHGLRAQQQLDERAHRDTDYDLMMKITLMMTGTISPEARARRIEHDPRYAEDERERLALEAEFRPLLGGSGQDG